MNAPVHTIQSLGADRIRAIIQKLETVPPHRGVMKLHNAAWYCDMDRKTFREFFRGRVPFYVLSKNSVYVFIDEVKAAFQPFKVLNDQDLLRLRDRRRKPA